MAPPDWAAATTPRTFVLPVLMAWLVGWPERPMPASIAALLEAALDLFDNPQEPEVLQAQQSDRGECDP